MTTQLKEIFSGKIEGEPYGYFETLRDQGEIVWDDDLKAWIILSMDLCREIYRDDETFAHPYKTMRSSELIKKIRNDNPRTTQLLHGETQASIHRWWLKDLLGPRLVKEYSTSIVASAIDKVINSLQGRHSVDLVDDYCERIPVSIFCGLMGLEHLSAEEMARVKQLNEHQARFTVAQNAMRYEVDQPDAEAMEFFEKAYDASRELDTFILPVIRARKSEPREDFVSRLWEGGPNIFPDWNELDMLDMTKRLLFAGSDTTTHSIANALHACLTDPALMEAVRTGGQSVLDRFVEEMLRLRGTVQYRPRRATVDAEVGGKLIKAGDMIFPLLMAANRDPKHFDNPGVVDLNPRGGTTHVSFVVGPRACPGQMLARAEIGAAVSRLINAYPLIRLDTSKPKPVMRGGVLKSFRPIWALLD